jgi:hypothetical protein
MTRQSQQNSCLYFMRGGLLLAMLCTCALPRVASARDTDSTESSESAPKSTEDDSASDGADKEVPQALNQQPTSAEELDKTLSEPTHDRPSAFNQKTAGYIVGGVGVVGIALGTVFGLRVESKNNHSNSICPTGQLCSPQDQDRYHSSVSDAKSARTLSFVSFGVGGAALATGIILVVTAPKAKPAKVSFVPAIDIGRLGAAIQGVF